MTEGKALRVRVMYLDTLSGYLHPAGKTMEISKDALRFLGEAGEIKYHPSLSSKPQIIQNLTEKVYRCGVYLVVVQEKEAIAIPLGKRMWEAISLE
ncbi:MAG: hypothetical protein QMD08_08030 [Actinomycetota bacterium]|nr:hypothetical protein [Actinomycetota bacterium]